MNLPLVPNRFETRRAIVFATVVLGIALLHPAYYLVRLGVLTPQELNGGIAAELPTPGRFLAPLIDPEIGFVPWLPATAILALAGLILLARSARTALTEDRRLALSAACAVVVGVWFLAVFAQTTNVNSGGTVHVSRYALWLLPLTLPAIATVTRYVDARMPGLLLAGALGLFLVYLAYFWPAQPERYVEHSPQAAWLLTHFPDTYRSIPEVFVERTLHIDGGVRASAADPSCRLILIVAERPEHPCPLTSFEQARLAVWWQDGDAAVWVRRGAGGESSLTTALAAS